RRRLTGVSALSWQLSLVQAPQRSGLANWQIFCWLASAAVFISCRGINYSNFFKKGGHMNTSTLFPGVYFPVDTQKVLGRPAFARCDRHFFTLVLCPAPEQQQQQQQHLQLTSTSVLTVTLTPIAEHYEAGQAPVVSNYWQPHISPGPHCDTHNWDSSKVEEAETETTAGTKEKEEEEEEEEEEQEEEVHDEFRNISHGAGGD
ncbi:hypothetical protein POJ06DRAFT_290300, partial [Lipomyces tetrasporus]